MLLAGVEYGFSLRRFGRVNNVYILVSINAVEQQFQYLLSSEWFFLKKSSKELTTSAIE